MDEETKMTQETTEEYKGQLICPRCGKSFAPKEKKCPHCGLKNNLKRCKTCGATIAKNAKCCPKCGAKNKKPIYKRIWFWVVAILIGTWLIQAISESITKIMTGTSVSPDEAIVGVWEEDSAYDDKMQEIELTEEEKVKMVFDENHKAIVIMAGMSMGESEWEYHKTDIDGNMIYSITSGDGDFKIVGPRGKYKEYKGKILMELDGQIVLFAKNTDESVADYEGTTSVNDLLDSINRLNEIVDSMDTDGTEITQGKKNALRKAEEYLNLKAFSRYKLIEQLEYNGFSVEEAEYAVDHCDVDWEEQAAKKAAEYLNMQAFSRERLREQLKYEGFTTTQIEYALKQNGY